MTRFIELSHPIEDGMITYKGLPAPIICDYLSREASKSHYGEGTSFQIGKIEMVANSGTYIDAPFHRFEDGADIADLPLSSMADLEGICITVSGEVKRMGLDLIQGLDVKNKAVLFHTGWDRHWRSDAYYEGHPHLTAEAGAYLRDGGARLVGIDSLNVDDTSCGDRPVHTILLDADVLIVEHLCGLEQLPRDGFRFNAVPAPVKGLGSFPVRAYATMN